jgi:putative transposase
MKRKSYTSDLTDGEWARIAPLLPAAKRGGRPRTTDLREVVNAIFYLLRGGCSWRLLPHDFPVWQTVYDYFRTWRRAGVWERIHRVLRRQVRRQAGRAAEPSAAIIDTQSVKTTERGGEHGYDGGKKVNGRKRHVLVDTLGLVLKVKVHAANISEAAGAKLLLTPGTLGCPRLQHLWADMGYRGEFLTWIKEQLGWSVEIVQRPRKWGRYPVGVEPPPLPVFTVLPRRWVVERTLAWIGRYRRMSKEYDYLPESSEAWIYAAMSRLMLKRLTHQPGRS